MSRIRPEQIPTDLKQPAMDAGWPAPPAPPGTAIDYVFILHDSDPYGFASFTIPRLFADSSIAIAAAAEHLAAGSEWVPFGPTGTSLMLKSGSELTSLTIRRVRVER